MAEEIRRRVAALRLAALLAVAVTLAGLTSRDTPEPASATSARAETLPTDSVGSAQVIDDSLKFRDFKAGTVLKPSQAAALFLKLDDAASTYLSKLEAATDYLHKVDAAELYLKLADAQATYLKLDSAADLYLEKTFADETYLHKDDAADTYLDKQLAADTYLDKQLAADTYLDKLDAASNFLQKLDAAELYLKVEDAAGYLKLEDAAATYLKLDAANSFLQKVDAAELYLEKTTADDLYLHKDAAADLYLSKVEAEAVYIKQGTQIDAFKLGGIAPDGFVQGRGAVRTGVTLMGFDGVDPLMDLPGLAKLSANAHGLEGNEVILDNQSGGTLLISYDGKSLLLDAGQTTGILIGLNQPSLVQVISLGDKGGIATLTLGVTTLGENQLIFTGQALVGGP